MIDQIRHAFVHAFAGILADPVSSAIWAIMIELGDWVKKREDPDKHPEGFSLLDLTGRLAGCVISAIAWALFPELIFEHISISTQLLSKLLW